MKTPADIRFMLDHMLIKLGKYLRILGYDAGWDLKLRTHELILRANAGDRVFLTRNARLAAQYPAPRRVLTLKTGDPATQLGQVIAQYDLDPALYAFTQCIRCNRLLDAVADKAEIRERVHPNVWARFDHFFRCPACGTVFWRGSHVGNTSRKLGLPFAPEAPLSS
jgi:hypothetical protein